MRGKYERSPGFRLLKTDSFAIMFYGYYQGLLNEKHLPVYRAAKMFTDLYPTCDLDVQEIMSGYQRLCKIVRDMQKK